MLLRHPLELALDHRLRRRARLPPDRDDEIPLLANATEHHRRRVHRHVDALRGDLRAVRLRRLPDVRRRTLRLHLLRAVAHEDHDGRVVQVLRRDLRGLRARGARRLDGLARLVLAEAPAAQVRDEVAPSAKRSSSARPRPRLIGCSGRASANAGDVGLNKQPTYSDLHARLDLPPPAATVIHSANWVFPPLLDVLVIAFFF